MSATLRYASVLLLSFAALSCSDLGTEPEPAHPTLHPLMPLDLNQQTVVYSANWFGMNLFKALNASNAGKSLMISPLSVSMALGLTLNGARGTTSDAMGQTLGLAGMTSDQINTSYADLIQGLENLNPNVQMELANSIWYPPTLQVEQEFKDVNSTYFNAQIRSLNFSAPGASGIINGWVSEATHGKITTIVPDPIPRDVVMYLINAVYFKGQWKHQFDPSNTIGSVFHLSDGSTVPCQMMSTRDSLPCFIDSDLVCVDLPYGSIGFSMTILLPPEGVDIDEYIAMDVGTGMFTAPSPRMRISEVQLSMPKFKLDYEQSLNAVLKQLGMGIALSGAADFTGIDRRGGPAISEVLHKTFVQVDEVGTEATAATSVEMWRSINDEIPSIVVNRPFVFVIREHLSNTILFIGKVVQPEW